MQTLDARAGDPLMQLRELTLEAQVLAEGTPERAGEARRPIEGVRHVIFVASNKGGVGKSTVAANLAVGLAERTGGRVGLLDADVTGPNQPTIFGLQAGMQADTGLRLIEAHGVSLASLGQLVDKGLPVIWRGPMIGTAVRWLLREVPWGELEYLVIDLPPGTSDAAITAAQEVPAVGLIVTTPSMVAVEDAAKMREMYGRFDVEVLGVVENMAHFTCPHCEGRTAIFGQGVEDAAREWGLDVLSTIPIEPGVSAGDVPVVVGNPESPASEAIRGLVETVMSRTGELAESR